MAGQRLGWRGEMEAPRAVLTGCSRLADERGEAVLLRVAAPAPVRAASSVPAPWEEAARLLDEWAQSSNDELLSRRCTSAAARCLPPGRGLPEETERVGRERRWRARAGDGVQVGLGSRRCGRAGSRRCWSSMPARAAESLRPVWEHAQREGVDEPGVFPVAPELVEALAERR